MISCSACAHLNPPGSRFCNACGAAVSATPAVSPSNTVIAQSGAASYPALGPTIPAVEHGSGASVPAGDFAPGRPIDAAKRYVVDRVIGRGGFGAAYLVYDRRLNRYCVAKRQLPNPAWSAETIRQVARNFRREAELLVSLNAPGHPNIPEIYEFLPEHGCLVMKYIEGEDLGRALAASGGRLPLGEALAVARDVCSALVYMHSRTPEPVLHRDIKPSNILRDSGGRVWLIDFGLSKAAPGPALPASAAGTQMAGTFGYSPPEQWRAAAEPRSDIYALAATLHTLLTGHRPAQTRADLPAFLRGEGSPFPPARQLEPGVSAAIEALIAAALHFDPRQRPDAASFLAALEHAIAPAARPDLQAPDGAALHGEADLARWAETSWAVAANWLYSSLPAQLAHVWGRNKLADDMRSLVARYPGDRDAGLDALLALLDPRGFGAATPNLAADRRTVDFGALAPAERRDEQVEIINRGRRYVRLEVGAPAWLVPRALTLALPPGARAQLRLTADMRRSSGGELRGAVLLRVGAAAGFRIDVQARSSRWRTLWQRATGAGRPLDWETGHVRDLRSVEAHRGGVWGVGFSADGQLLASGGWDDSVRLWQTDGTQLVRQIRLASHLSGLAYSPDGALLAAQSDGGVLLYGVDSYRLLRSLVGPGYSLDTAIFSADGSLLITGASDETLRLWRCADGAAVAQCGLPGGVSALASSPDGSHFAMARAGQAVELRNLPGLDAPQRLGGPHGAVAALAWSPDGALLAAGDHLGQVLIWGVSERRLLRRLAGHQGGVRALAFHPDGLLLASGGLDGCVSLWRADSGALLQVLGAHSASVLCLAFSRDGSLLASGGGDGVLTLWQPG